MKKLLIAAAALSVVAGAQAQSSVEVYGILDMSYSELKNTGADTNKLTSIGGVNSGNGSGILNGSRLGFRGTEDLGAGNKAKFVVEYGINLTAAEQTDGNNAARVTNTTAAVTGSAIGALRQGYVALENANLGTIAAGTMYSFVDASSGALAGSQAHGGSNNGQGAASLFKYGQNARAANAIAYISPSFSGVTLKLGTQQSETIRSSNSATVEQNSSNMYAIDYAAGPVKAGYAYQKIKNVTNATAVNAPTSATGTAGAGVQLVNLVGVTNDTNGISALAGTANLTYKVYGGSYNFGFATVGLNHSDYKNEVVTGAANVESSQNSLSASIPVSGTKWTINTAYTDGKLETTGVKSYDTTAYDLFAVYTLSKRTNVYLFNNQTKFDAPSTGTDYKQSQTGVGVRHSF
jgi:predicted porin